MKNNLQPDVWGPHGWKFIHYVALGYPDKPTDSDKTAYRNFYESLSDILPCQGCADHYRETIHAFPVKDHLASRDQLLRWSFDIHNTVNKRIAADVFTLQGDVSELFCLMGYTKQGDTLVYEGNNFRVLRRGIKLTEDAIEPTQCKFMTKEELTKHQILQASKKAYAEKLKKDKERVAEAERKHA